MNESTRLEREFVSFAARKQLFARGMHVCVCFSGGEDSSALLYILNRFRDELGIRLSACHFHHSIRDTEADRDLAFCRSVCEQYGIPLFTGQADVPALQKNSGKSIELVAREARYAWFAWLQEQEGIDRLATAHHKNDQAETLLYRMIRGTTVSGLRGIPVQRDFYVRPFLCISKQQIRSYVQENSIPFVTDSSNDCENYARNRLRKQVLPLLQEENEQVVEAISYLADCADEDDAFLASLLPAYAPKQDVGDLPNALLRRVIARNYRIYTDGKTLCRTHIDAIVSSVRSHRNGVIGLPDGYVAILQNGTLRYTEEKQNPYAILEPGELKNGRYLLCGGKVRISYGCECTDSTGVSSDEFVYNLSTEISLSCKGICGKISYRSRVSGDRIRINGVNRSVKKLLSEKKVPVYVRDSLPILYDENGIICVPFAAVADRVRPCADESVDRVRVEIAAKE